LLASGFAVSDVESYWRSFGPPYDYVLHVSTSAARVIDRALRCAP
jgi:hypothetical protein